jgi:hypothetical protein
MFFWFIGTAIVAVWWVFRDPAFDYRLLVVGSIVPLAELPFGARFLHSVTVSIVLLALLMVVTRGRKPIRKTLLGLPIGLLLHLVFTGAWTNAAVFWWPFFGVGFDDATHPIVARGWWNLPLELTGVGLCVWIVRSADLRDRDRRERFWRTGQLLLPIRPAS